MTRIRTTHIGFQRTRVLRAAQVPRYRMHGFTLVELLVVIAIIAMLVTALIPAVQSLRESARLAHCKNSMLQLIMAMQNYEMAHELYPAGVTEPSGGPIRNVARGHHHGWVIPLLPFWDEGNIHRRINPELSVYAEAHREVREVSIPVLLCPTEPEGHRDGKSNYAACHHDVEAPIAADNHGVFFLNSRIMVDDVLDGLSYTIFLGEKRMSPDDLGWMSGTRATLRNTGTPINVHPWSPGTAATPAEAVPVDGDAPGREGEGDKEDAVPENPGVRAAGTEQAQSMPNEAAGKATDNDEPSPKNQKRTKTELSVGGFASHHPAGAHIVFGDGRIQFMNSQIGQKVFQQLGHRHDGELLNAGDFRE